MKINNEELTNFLVKVRCNSEFADEDLVFDFVDAGLKISAVNTPKTVVLTANLMKGAFIEYESIGKIGIQHLTDIINILKTFGDEVEINVKGNVLIIKEKGRKVEIELLDTSMIIEAPELKKEMSFSETITLAGKEVNNFLNDANMNKDFTIYITTEKGKIIFNNTGKYKFTKDIETKDAIGGTKVRFGQPFVNAIKSFSQNIVLCMGDKMPLKLLEKTDYSNINIIIGPMTIEEQ